MCACQALRQLCNNDSSLTIKVTHICFQTKRCLSSRYKHFAIQWFAENFVLVLQLDCGLVVILKKQNFKKPLNFDKPVRS